NEYHKLVGQTEDGDLHIANRNLDTGNPTVAGKYRLADQGYDDLVRRLARDHFSHVGPVLKKNILEYFDSGAALDSARGPRKKEIAAALRALKQLPMTR